MEKIHLYILLNCLEVQPMVRKFEEYASSNESGFNQQDIEKYKEDNFVTWFTHVVDNDIFPNTEDLKVLARPPLRYYRRYDGYFVNGYKFHTKTRSQGRVTQNNGVCVKGSCYNDDEQDYFGELEHIYEVEYASPLGGCFVVLFKCRWFHPINGVRVDKHGLVEVKTKSYGYPNDPFVLASQCFQVYYMTYPSTNISNDWCAVVKTKSRAVYEVGHDQTTIGVDDDNDEESFFQEHERIRSRAIDVNSNFCLVDIEVAQEVDYEGAIDEDNHADSEDEEELEDNDEESDDDEQEFEDDDEESDDDEQEFEDDD